MSKNQLLAELQAENADFETLLDAIGPDRMTQPIAPGQWSAKDIVAHLTGWRRRTVQRLQAAARGEAPPPPPWPAHLTKDDEINAWLHAQTRADSVEAVRRASREVFDAMAAAVAALPEAGLTDPGRFPWLEGQPLSARALFGHFHEEHEPDLRRWLGQAGAPPALG